jgi:P-type conjugative transfer protein TrbJ
MTKFSHVRLKLAGAMAAIAAAAALFAAAPAYAQYEVYDPWTYQEQTITYTQAVQQVAQGVQELTQLQNQLTAQQNMIQNLGSDSTSAQLAAINSAAANILQQATGIGFNSATAGTTFANTYPPGTTVAGFNNQQLASALNTWLANNTAALQTSVQVQNAVAQNRTATTTAVQNAVNASNAATGQTAAVQATNQLLAAVAAQLAQLQDILITQSQAQVALAAAKQASSASSSSATSTLQGQMQTSITAAPGVTNTSTL